MAAGRSAPSRRVADADAPPDLKQYEDASGQRDCENGSGQDYVHGEDDPTHPGYGRARNSNLLFLPDLHSLNLFKGKLVP
jgi:hypothetical protein